MLCIALLSPHPLPPADDVAHHVLGEAFALAARGHAVTILAPGTERADLAEGRRRIAAAGADAGASLRAGPGKVLAVAIGRAFRAGAGRRIGGPIDVARNLETALAVGGFDVLHLHEPLSPSPALAVLRRGAGVRAATFHRPELLAGAAFLRPLITPSLADLDLRIASSPAVLAQFAEVLPGDYRLIPGGVDGRILAELTPPSSRTGVVIVARHRERIGLRFGLSIARELAEADRDLRIALIGPVEQPWRTRAALPRALRERIELIADEPRARIAAFVGARLAILGAAQETIGPVLAEAMAAGAVPLVPRVAEAASLVTDGRDGLVLTAFSRAEWTAAARDLLADDAARERLCRAAGATGGASTHERAGAELEAAYLAARDGTTRRAVAAGREDEATVLADLRLRPDPRIDPADLIAAAERLGLGAIAVAAPGGIGPALAVAALAPPALAVIVGQEIASAEGTLVGLFLAESIEDGLDARTTLARIHAQGGVAMIPHPAAAGVPAPEVLHQLAGAIDCFEVLTGRPDAGPQPDATPTLIQRLGVAATAGSGARAPEEVGTALTRLRPFHSAGDFLRALPDAQLLHHRHAPRNARRAGVSAR